MFFTFMLQIKGEGVLQFPGCCRSITAPTDVLYGEAKTSRS